MADSLAGGDLSGPSAMQSQSPLGRRKGLPLRPLPSSPSASSVSPPAAQSITFPLRPPRSPQQARGHEVARTEGLKQRQARARASPANGTATRGWFRAGGFRTPLRAAQIQPQPLRGALFQKLPSLTPSVFTLYLPIRQQQSTKDAALGLLNRQAREQSVPLLQQEDLVPRAQQHARSGHNTALVRSLCTENANLRSILAFLQHPVVSVAPGRIVSASQGEESTRGSLETALSDSQKEVGRLEEENARLEKEKKEAVIKSEEENARLRKELEEMRRCNTELAAQKIPGTAGPASAQGNEPAMRGLPVPVPTCSLFVQYLPCSVPFCEALTYVECAWAVGLGAGEGGEAGLVCVCVLTSGDVFRSRRSPRRAFLQHQRPWQRIQRLVASPRWNRSLLVHMLSLGHILNRCSRVCVYVYVRTICVCRYACMHVCVCVCSFVCVDHTHTYVYACVYDTHAYAHTATCVCVCVRMYLSLSLSLSLFVVTH